MFFIYLWVIINLHILLQLLIKLRPPTYLLPAFFLLCAVVHGSSRLKSSIIIWKLMVLGALWSPRKKPLTSTMMMIHQAVPTLRFTATSGAPSSSSSISTPLGRTISLCVAVIYVARYCCCCCVARRSLNFDARQQQLPRPLRRSMPLLYGTTNDKVLDRIWLPSLSSGSLLFFEVSIYSLLGKKVTCIWKFYLSHQEGCKNQKQFWKV